MKFIRIVSLVLASAGLCAPFISGREENADKTIPPLRHDVVVTATRIETPSQEVASSITVITRAVLERTHRTMVIEALEDVLGTNVNRSGGSGGVASVMIRGANSEHTLVLLDGVELNDPMSPSRSYDFSQMPIDQVERIEILRGPQSPLFGSDALGGVINIISRRGEGRSKIGFSGSAGSLKTTEGRLDLCGASRTGNYFLGLTAFRSDGISAADTAFAGNTEKDGYWNLAFSGRAGLKLGDNLDLDLSFRSLRSRSEIDNFGGAYGDDPNNSQRYDWFFGRAQLRGLYLQGHWESKLGIAVTGSNRRNTNLVDPSHPFDSERGRFRSSLSNLDWQNNFFLHPSHTLTVGAEYKEERGSSEYRAESLWGPYSSLFPKREAKELGVYVQDQFRIGSRFFAAAGARIDSHSQSGTVVTYRIAPAWIINSTGTKFKATLGTGFKSPSLYQLYAPPTLWGPIGNKALKPEESRGWDCGVEQEFSNGKLRLDIAYFQNHFRNLVSFDLIRGYINIGRAETKGVEIVGQASPIPGLFIQASYTRMSSKNKDNGLDLLRRPRDKFSANLNLHWLKRLNIDLRVISLGRRSDLDFNGIPSQLIILRAYTLWNASFSVRLNPQAEIFIRLDNVLDRRYETIYGYGTPGFGAYAGIKLGVD